MVDGRVVLGTDAGFKAAVDVADDGRSLEDDEVYQETLEDAPDERLGYIYFNIPAFLEGACEVACGRAARAVERASSRSPLLATCNADESGVRFEATVPKSLAAGLPGRGRGRGHAPAELPADSWLAMAQPDLGKTLDQYIDDSSAAVGRR